MVLKVIEIVCICIMSLCGFINWWSAKDKLDRNYGLLLLILAYLQYIGTKL